MAKPAAAPPPWGTVGNYGLSNYQDPLPWGAPNPLGGGATPWSGGVRLDAVGLAAFAAAGFEPEVPTPAESFNEWLRQAQESLQWVQDGSAAAGANAHIVETDGAGLISAQAAELTLGAFGVGPDQLPLPHGATVPNTKILTIENGADIALEGDAAIAGPNTSSATVGKVEYLAGGPAPSTAGTTVGSDGEFFFGPSRRVHASSSGWVYATGDQEAETAQLATLFTCETSLTIEGISPGDVRIIVEGWGQRTAAGAVDIDVQQDQGTGTWIDVGAAQQIDWIDNSSATAWSPFRHERTLNIGTSTATKFRLKVTALGGASVKVRESYLRVVNKVA